MYAIVETGGKQYKVAEGDVIHVEALQAKVGSLLPLEKVLMVSGEEARLGTPWVQGARVLCEVLSHDKAKKVLIYKQKRRKNYRRKRGHRQLYTELRVQKIEV